MKHKRLQANLNIISSWYVTKFSRDLYLPSLAAIAIGLGTSNTLIQGSVSIYYLGLTLSRLIWTPLSDIFGRRKIILLCLPLFIIGGIISTASEDIWFFILGRFIQAMGIGCITSLGRAILNDIYDQSQTTRAITYLNLFAVWAPAVATIIGGHLQQYFGWRSNFIFLTLCGVLLFAQAYYALQETSTPSPKHEKKFIQHLCQIAVSLFRNRDYCRYLLVYSFIFGGSVVYFTASPILFVHTMQIPAHVYGYFAIFTVFGILIGQFIANRLCDKVDINKLILTSIFISLFAAVSLIAISLFFKPQVLLIMIPIFIYFISNGLLSPITKAASMGVIPNTAGTAAALFGMAQGLSSTFTSFFTAFFHERTAMPMALLLFGLSLFALGSFYLFAPKAIPE